MHFGAQYLLLRFTINLFFTSEMVNVRLYSSTVLSFSRVIQVYEYGPAKARVCRTRVLPVMSRAESLGGQRRNGMNRAIAILYIIINPIPVGSSTVRTFFQTIFPSV